MSLRTLNILLETFICPPTYGHPQNQHRLVWKPQRNNLILIILLCYFPLCYNMSLPLYCITYGIYSLLFLFFLNIPPCLYLFHMTLFHNNNTCELYVMNTVTLDMFAFNFVWSTTLASIQVRKVMFRFISKNSNFVFDF